MVMQWQEYRCRVDDVYCLGLWTFIFSGAQRVPPPHAAIVSSLRRASHRFVSANSVCNCAVFFAKPR